MPISGHCPWPLWLKVSKDMHILSRHSATACTSCRQLAALRHDACECADVISHWQSSGCLLSFKEMRSLDHTFRRQQDEIRLCDAAVQSLIYAGQIMDDEKQLLEYRVPKVSCSLQQLEA